MSVWAIVSFPEADKPSVQMLCDLTGAPGWMVEIEGKAYVVDSVVNGKLLCKV
jgi:hypothetical protein